MSGVSGPAAAATANDDESGLRLVMPAGWETIPGPAGVVVGVESLESPRHASTVVGLVWQRPDDADLESLIADAMDTWMRAQPSTRILAVEGARELTGWPSVAVTSIYSTGVLSLVLLSLTVDCGAALVRIDVTVPAAHSRAADAIVADLMRTVGWPTAAPARDPDADAVRAMAEDVVRAQGRAS